MIGVVAAGGASRRMGTDKALMLIEGRSFLDHASSALDEACDRVVVAGRQEPAGPWELIGDTAPHRRGPLAALEAVAARYPDEPLMLVGVDQPWLRAETVRRLIDRFDALPVVPVAGGFRQPLCAVYPAGLGSLAGAELAAGGSLQTLLDVTAYDAVGDWATWGEDGRSWYSADTPEALADGLDRWGPP